MRHRAKLVGLRSHCRAAVHDAVLAECGVQVLMSDLFGAVGKTLLDRQDWGPHAWPDRIIAPVYG